MAGVTQSHSGIWWHEPKPIYVYRTAHNHLHYIKIHSFSLHSSNISAVRDNDNVRRQSFQNSIFTQLHLHSRNSITHTLAKSLYL